MTENYAYIAGLLDGEGHFGIHGSRFLCVISCKMNDRRGLDLVKQIFGGNIYFYKGKTSKNHEGSFAWAMAERNTLQAVLPLIIPFLRVKRAHAELLLQFCCEPRPMSRTNKIHYREVMAGLNSVGVGSSILKAELEAALDTSLNQIP